MSGSRRRGARPRRLPKVLRRHEWEPVIDAAGVGRDQPLLALRDPALIAFLLHSGVRRDELRRARLSDLDIERGTLHVLHGKGDKERWVAVGPPGLYRLECYLDVRLQDEKEDGPIFVSRKGGGMISGSQIAVIVKDAGRKAGHGESLHPHTCRHSHATRLVEIGWDLFRIADQMGHEDLETTRLYTHIALDERVAGIKDL